MYICISFFHWFSTIKGRCFHLSPGSGHGKPLCWCQRAKRPMQSLKNLQSFLKKMTSLLILGMMVSYPRDEIHAMNFGAMMMYESLLATA